MLQTLHHVIYDFTVRRSGESNYWNCNSGTFRARVSSTSGVSDVTVKSVRQPEGI
jgi:hypothetical protein